MVCGRQSILSANQPYFRRIFPSRNDEHSVKRPIPTHRLVSRIAAEKNQIPARRQTNRAVDCRECSFHGNPELPDDLSGGKFMLSSSNSFPTNRLDIRPD